jgi:hypothetical protein
MGRRLDFDSRCLNSVVSEDLSERIMDDVTVAGPVRIPMAINLRPVLAVAACILIIGAPALIWLLRPSPPTPGPQYTDVRAAARELYESGTLLAGGLTRVGNPFESEIQNLTADTESAFRFVIANVAATPSMAQLPN